MQLAFTHWLERSVGYAALLIAARQALHGQVAGAIEQLPGRILPPADDLELRDAVLERLPAADAWLPASADLAHHWKAAGRPRRAGQFLLLAAWGAENKGNMREALALADRAIAELEAAGDPASLSAAYRMRGRACEWLGLVAEGLAAYDAAEAFPLTGTAGQVARSRIRWGRAAIFQRTGRHAEARDALAASLACAQAASAPREEAFVHNSAGIVNWSLGRLDEAERAFSEAARLRAELGETRGEMLALANVAALRIGRSDHEEGMRLHRLCIEFARRTGNRIEEAVATGNVGVSLATRGQYAEAIPRYEEAVALWQQVGDPWGEAACLGGIGSALYELERYAESLVALDRSVAAAEPMAGADVMCDVLAQRALCRMRSGDRSGAERDATRAEVRAKRADYAIGRIVSGAALALIRGEARLAREAASEAAAIGLSHYEADATATEAEVLSGAGRPDEARAAALRAASLARSCGSLGVARRAERLLASTPQKLR